MVFEFSKIKKAKKRRQDLGSIFLLIILFSFLIFFPEEKQTAFKMPDRLKQQRLTDDYFSTAWNGVGFLRERARPKENIFEPQLLAKSYLLVYVSESGSRQTLAAKDAEKKFPIASLTKLMSAIVVEQNFRPNQILRIPTPQAAGKGSLGRFDSGGEFYVQDLSRSLLIESDNDAAITFAMAAGVDKFIGQMNANAKNIGMRNTAYFNPSGLDPLKDPENRRKINRSTARDLAILATYVRDKYPDIFEKTALKEYELKYVDGRTHHLVKNTSNIISMDMFPGRIIGSKTGQTPCANMNLITVAKPIRQGGYLIGVVLGSDFSFTDMRNLLRWADRSFFW